MKPTIRDSVFEVVKQIEADKPETGLHIAQDRECYEWIDYGDEDGGRIMPSLNSGFVSPFLYRGQTRRYSPCLPTVYRRFPLVKNPNQLSESERHEYLLAQTRLAEFLHGLSRHPASLYSQEIGLHLCRTGLAQHYGIATDRLDLTQDHEVAAFFATCAKSPKGEWLAVDDGIGVVYRFDLTAFPRLLGDTVLTDLFKTIELIGLQSFPRPGEQKAWTIRLPLGFDFERLPMDAFLFRQTKVGGQFYLDRFHGGRALFPNDPLAEVAEWIANSATVPLSALHAVLKSEGCDPARLEEAVNSYAARIEADCAVSVSEREPIALTERQLEKAQLQCEDMRTTLLQKVGVRGITFASVKGHLSELQHKDTRRWGHFARATAAKNLGSLGHRAACALPALRDALHDAHPMVRECAAQAISQIETDLAKNESVD